MGKRLSEVALACVGHLRLVVRVVVALVVITALPVAIYYGYHALLASDYFRVTAIRIDGNERLSRARVLDLAGLDRPTSIFTVDTSSVAQALLDDPWVVEVEVTRDLPRTVRITLREREPAGWIYWDGLMRVDRDGVPIEAGDALTAEGPLITGIEPVDPDLDGGESAALIREALVLSSTYQARGLNRFDELAQVHFDELMGFSLLTREAGIEVRLGPDRYADRLDRLESVLRTLEGEDLRGRYILLDGEGDLTRIAVGPPRPGRVAFDPIGAPAPR